MPINDGDGDDMMWMQLVKVGNVFDRAKAPAWAQPRPSHWTTMFLWESRAIIRRRRLPTVAGCAINDGDGDDMLRMQLVKVGNVFN